MKKTLLLLTFFSINTLFPAATCTPKPEYIIGCDVGRVEVVTGIFAVVGKKPKLEYKYTTTTTAITDFAAHIAAVVADASKEHGITIKRACFAAPGNTNAAKNFVRAPHLSFVVDGCAIQEHTTITKALVVNDFECMGFGIQAIDQKSIVTLHPGKPREHGTRAIIGAGNGLGSGLMLWDTPSACYLSSPLSYSFADFCPHTTLELELSHYLQETAEKIPLHLATCASWGKVLGTAGGIMRIYDFLNQRNADKSVPKAYANYLEIFAHRSDDKRCKDAVDLYMHLYARLLRNVAYAQLPYNGIYITNTVAERNPELFTDPAFAQEFLNTNNSFLRDYLMEIPVYLAVHPDMQIYGAAMYALIYA